MRYLNGVGSDEYQMTYMVSFWKEYIARPWRKFYIMFWTVFDIVLVFGGGYIGIYGVLSKQIFLFPAGFSLISLGVAVWRLKYTTEQKVIYHRRL